MSNLTDNLADAIFDEMEANLPRGITKDQLRNVIDTHMRLSAPGVDAFRRAAHELAVLDTIRRGVTPPAIDPRGWVKAVRS